METINPKSKCLQRGQTAYSIALLSYKDVMRQRKSLPIRFQGWPTASYMTKRKPNIITSTSISPSFLLDASSSSGRQSSNRELPYRNTWSAADYILTDQIKFL